MAGVMCLVLGFVIVLLIFYSGHLAGIVDDLRKEIDAIDEMIIKYEAIRHIILREESNDA